MTKLVLIRHGESEDNAAGRFSGWRNPDLTAKGKQQAANGGKLLKDYEFDVAFTSPLKRAKETLRIVLEEAHDNPDIITAWQLNEKHYGALQGQNKKEKAKEVGEEQVFKWRRAYDERPPPLHKDDPTHPANNEMYKDVDKVLLPAAECLHDVVNRVSEYWKKEIKPRIMNGHRVIVSAHGNSLRALIKIIEGISDEDIANLDLPKGVPIVLHFKNGEFQKREYLGDQEKIQAEINAVRNEAKN